MLSSLAFWHWFVLAVVLLILEVVVPGTFFLWLGLAAAVVGCLVFLVPGIGWEWQLILFALLCVAAVFVWRSILKKHPIESEEPTLNRRGEQYMGNIYTLTEAIENGSGRVRVGDSWWQVQGPDLAQGSRVRVWGVKAAALLVEPVRD